MSGLMTMLLDRRPQKFLSEMKAIHLYMTITLPPTLVVFIVVLLPSRLVVIILKEHKLQISGTIVTLFQILYMLTIVFSRSVTIGLVHNVFDYYRYRYSLLLDLDEPYDQLAGSHCFGYMFRLTVVAII